MSEEKGIPDPASSGGEAVHAEEDFRLRPVAAGDAAPPGTLLLGRAAEKAVKKVSSF
jgi:hypothetical protein